MNDKYIKEKIQKEYERIMKIIDGAKVYDVPVDLLDIRHLVVFSYYAGYQQQFEKFINFGSENA